MPRVLMLCYYFPPIIACGANRSVGFVQNLPALGWEPVVLSVEHSKDPWIRYGASVPPGIQIERTKEWNLAGVADTLHAAFSKLGRLAGIDSQFNYFRDALIPDQQVSWFSTKAGEALARNCDIVYATCSPFSSAASALAIGRRSKKPVVLDFRDPWTMNSYIHHGKRHQAAIELLERQAVTECDRLILNTSGTLRLYQEKYPQFAEKMSAINNGYDELTPIGKIEQGETFRIMHIGSFYGSRSPRLLLEALSELPDIPAEFVQVGGDFPERTEFEKKVRITCHPVVPRQEALRIMNDANLLYLKQGWEPGVKDYVAVAAKTYEYLATGLPILAETPPGDNAEILRSYGSNVSVINTLDVQAVKQAVVEAYRRRNEIQPKVNETFAHEFHRRTLTEKLVREFATSLKLVGQR